MPANQKRRGKKPRSTIKKPKHNNTDWSDNSCGWLCLKDPINLLQLYEVLLQFTEGDGMFPYALPSSYCLLVRLPLFGWEDHLFPLSTHRPSPWTEWDHWITVSSSSSHSPLPSKVRTTWQAWSLMQRMLSIAQRSQQHRRKSYQYLINKKCKNCLP